MAAINTLAVRDATLHQIVKRGNWASKNVGVVLVFAIVFVGMCPLPVPNLWPVPC